MEKKEVHEEDKKTEEKKVPAKEEDKKTEDALIRTPKVGEPTSKSIFTGLTGVNEHVAILSFLHYRDLIKVAKSSRYAFNFIMDAQARKRILGWKPDKEEETRINNYILSLIQAIDTKE